MNATTDKSYLPGEEVVIEFFFKNITPEPFEIDPFPPHIEIVGPPPPELICLFPAGTETKSLEPQEVISHTVMWDQRDDQGQPVDCGAYWFQITGGGTLVDEASFVVFILPPRGGYREDHRGERIKNGKWCYLHLGASETICLWSHVHCL